MSFEKTSIKNIIDGILDDEYLLPVIQRGLVWKTEQIEKLFESIYLGYPIGSFLFWKYKIEDKNYTFYKFVNKINEYKQPDIFKYNGTNKKIIAVLDGQQRLTSLYIGLTGDAKIHKKGYKRDNINNFEDTKLFVNLLKDHKNINNYEEEEEFDDNKTIYENNKKFFKFKKIRNNENTIIENGSLWFNMTKILDFEYSTDYKKYIDNLKDFSEEEQDLIQNNFNELFNIFCKKEIISYYKEETQDLDKVLDIFVRINSGGTKLSKSDFLMSVITNNWIEAKETISNTLIDIENSCGFRISQDVFLRGCLLLTDNNIIINVNNFKNKTILDIKNNFNEIVDYIKLSCNIFGYFGFNNYNLNSRIILIVLALYLKENNIKNFNKNINLLLIKKWIYTTILSGVLNGQTNDFLLKLREIIKNYKGDIPLEEIKQMSKKLNKNMDINEDTIEAIVDKKAEHNSQFIWSILLILYPDYKYDQISFDEDHIFPKSLLTNKQLKSGGGNYIANIQLLKSQTNKEKNNKLPFDWIIEEFKTEKDISDYKKENLIPEDIELTLDNFDIFIEKRRKMIIDKILEKI